MTRMAALLSWLLFRRLKAQVKQAAGRVLLDERRTGRQGGLGDPFCCWGGVCFGEED
jgi:hypothetical protein